MHRHGQIEDAGQEGNQVEAAHADRPLRRVLERIGDAAHIGRAVKLRSCFCQD